MHIEFQLNAGRLLAAFLNRLRANPICIPNQFPLDSGECSGQTLIDHIAFPGMGMLRRAPESTSVPINLPGGKSSNISVNRLQIAQPVEVHLVQRADLAASNTAATDPCLVASGQLIFDLAVQTSGGEAELCISVAGIETAVEEVPPQVAAAIESFMAAKLPPSCTPFDLGPLKQMLGGQPSIANAGVSSDSGFSFLAIRLEVGSPASGAAAAWTSFFGGSVSNHLFGNAWSVFVDKDLILPVIENEVESAIDDYNDDHWYHYNVFWGPNATWSNANDKAQITVKLNGELENACTCFLFPQDIETEFHSTVNLSCELANQLTSTIDIDTISHDDFSISCCAATNMLAWTVFGPYYLDELPAGEFWGAFLLGLAFQPTVFFGSLVAVGEVAGMLPPPSPPGATCQKSDEDEVKTTCTQPLDLGEKALLGVLTLTGLRGLSNGPLLTGTVDPLATIDAAEISVSSYGFERRWKNPCELEPELVARAHIGIDDVSDTPKLAPIELCEVTVLDDPPQSVGGPSQFEPYMTVENFLSVYYSIDFEIPEGALTPEYLQNPYDLRVLIKTSAGVRLVTIPKIEMLSDADKAQLDSELLYTKNTKCKRWIGWWNDKVFLGDWLPDPPPLRGIEVEHLWQMFASELHPGDAVGFQDHSGKSLGVAHSTEGLAQLSALVAPAAHNELTFVGTQQTGGARAVNDVVNAAVNAAAVQPSSSRIGARRGAPGGNRARLEVKQVLLARASIVRLQRECLHFALGQFGGFPALVCTTAADVRVYDLRNPVLPRLASQSAISGARGALPWGGGLLVWGESGLRNLPRAARSERTAVESADESADLGRIEQVHTTRGYVYALGGETVHVLDRTLRKVHELKAPGAMHLAITGRTLLVASVAGIAIFRLDDPVHPAEAGFYEMPAISALTSPILPNPTDTIFARRSEGGGVLLYFGLGQQPSETAEFESDPWFLNVASAGPMLGRLEERRHLISILAATFSAKLPAEERVAHGRSPRLKEDRHKEGNEG